MTCDLACIHYGRKTRRETTRITIKNQEVGDQGCDLYMFSAHKNGNHGWDMMG